MDIKQAVQIIKQACGSVQANLETHQQIQLAIQSVEEALKPKPKKEKEVSKKDK